MSYVWVRFRLEEFERKWYISHQNLLGFWLEAGKWPNMYGTNPDRVSVIKQTNKWLPLLVHPSVHHCQRVASLSSLRKIDVWLISVWFSFRKKGQWWKAQRNGLGILQNAPERIFLGFQKQPQEGKRAQPARLRRPNTGISYRNLYWNIRNFHQQQVWFGVYWFI